MDAVIEAQKWRQSDLDDLVSEVEQLEGKFIAGVLALKPAAQKLADLDTALQLAARDETITAGRSAWAQTHRAPQISGLGSRALVLIQAAEAVKNEKH